MKSASAMIPSVALSDVSFYGNIPLKSAGSTPVRLFSSSGVVSTGTITWATTRIDVDGEVVVRVNDSLLLLMPVAGVADITLNSGVYCSNVALLAGKGVPVLFDKPGQYLITTRTTAGVEVARFKVSAVSVNFDGPVASEVGFRREKGVEVKGGVAGNVVFATDTPAVLTLSVKETTNYGSRLYLTTLGRGSPVAHARLLSPSGPILSQQAIDEFVLETPAITDTIINSETGSGNNELIMRPHIPKLTGSFTMFAHKSTFANGIKAFTVDTTNIGTRWDAVTGEYVGVIPFSIVRPVGETRYCFRVLFDQHSTYGTPVSNNHNINGGVCDFTVTKIKMCLQQFSKIMPIRGLEQNRAVHTQDHTFTLVNCAATGDPATINCKTEPPGVGQVIWDPIISLNGTAVGKYNVKIDGTDFGPKLSVVDLKPRLVNPPISPTPITFPLVLRARCTDSDGADVTDEVTWTWTGPGVGNGPVFTIAARPPTGRYPIVATAKCKDGPLTRSTRAYTLVVFGGGGGGGGGGVIGGGDDGEEENCDEPAGPNRGEVEAPEKFTICLPENSSSTEAEIMDVVHRIITVNTPRERPLRGMLRLTRKSGDASIIRLTHNQKPYQLGTQIPVEELGHVGCGIHDWHGGIEQFSVFGVKPGRMVIEAEVDPVADDGGDGTATKKATIDILVGRFQLKPDTPVLTWPEIASRIPGNVGDYVRVLVTPTPSMTLAEIKERFGFRLKMYTKHHLPDGYEDANLANADTVFQTQGGGVMITYKAATLIRLGVIPEQEAGRTDYHATCDNTVGSPRSTLADSEAFNAGMMARGSENWVKAQDNGRYADEIAPANKAFLRYAGSELIWFQLCHAKSEYRQIRQQAKWLYWSGHGHHSNATLAAVDGDIGPAEMLWNSNVDTAIISGCSVLDIKDYRAMNFGLQNWLEWHAAGGAWSPGEQWERTGVKYLLGYAWNAPADTQGAPAIVNAFIANMNAGMPVPEAWMSANDLPLGSNACALDLSGPVKRYLYFNDRSDGTRYVVTKAKSAGGW